MSTHDGFVLFEGHEGRVGALPAPLHFTDDFGPRT